MGYALVSAGPVAAATFTPTLSPAFGQSTTAGDLLVAWLADNDSDASGPFTTSSPGWSIALQWGGAFQWGAIAYKPNCGAGETAPTFTSAGTPTFVFSQLREFSGGATSSPVDKTGNGGTSGGATQTATNSAADGQAGDLIVSGTVWNGSTSSLTISNTMHDTNGSSVTPSVANNTGTGTGPYYNFMHGIAGSTLGASGDTATSTLSGFESGGCGIVSFKPASGGTNISAQLASALAAVALAANSSETIAAHLAAALAADSLNVHGLAKQNISAQLAASLGPAAIAMRQVGAGGRPAPSQGDTDRPGLLRKPFLW
jgi:hypothetical protein